MFGGPAIAQKYKVHQNAPFKFFFLLMGTVRMFPGPAVALDGPACDTATSSRRSSFQLSFRRTG